jgi:hypothetical protein
MAHEHDPSKPAEACDEHLREHAAVVIAELLKRDLLVIGTRNDEEDGLDLTSVLSMGIGNDKVYIAIGDAHDHGHDHSGHDHHHHD